MRYTVGGLGTVAALAVGCLMAAGGTASAQPVEPASLYAPSALVMTVGKEEAGVTAVQRAVTLTCSPKAGGTHPTPKQACGELRSAQGDFGLTTASRPDRMCPTVLNPVVVTLQGVWDGRPVSYQHRFSNTCAMSSVEGTVWSF